MACDIIDSHDAPANPTDGRPPGDPHRGDSKEIVSKILVPHWRVYVYSTISTTSKILILRVFGPHGC